MALELFVVCTVCAVELLSTIEIIFAMTPPIPLYMTLIFTKTPYSQCQPAKLNKSKNDSQLH